DPLVLTEQVADLATADTDIPGGDVGELPDVTLQLGHERLAEPHHLAVGLPFGVEVGAPFPRPHRERGERVLEDLFERQELEHPQVHRRVEAEPSLVGADRAAHLDTEPPVDLHGAVVVDPRHAEDHDTLGLEDPFEDLRLGVGGVPLLGQLDGLGDLLDRLMELGLTRVLRHQLGHQAVCVLTHPTPTSVNEGRPRCERARQAYPYGCYGGTVPRWLAVLTAIPVAYVVWRLG